MQFQRIIVLLFASLFTTFPALAAARASAAWEGLTGLYTQPTAEALSPHQFTLTYSEIRFGQTDSTEKLRDVFFTGNIAYAPIARLELALTTRHEMVKFGVPNVGGFTNELDDRFLLGHVKYVIVTPQPRKTGIAVGVMDITDSTDTLEETNVERGRRFFLVGTLDWLSAGFSHDSQGVGAFAGARLGISKQVDLIAEYVSQPIFVQLSPEPDNSANFNLGLRFYPLETPNLRVDVAAVGDGSFNLGFSFSYLIK